MSFGAAVAYVQAAGLVCVLLLLSVPVGAVLAIQRGKRNRPGARLVFPRAVLWGWVALLMLAVGAFFTLPWYGESGPPPQTAAAQATMALLAIVLAVAAIDVGLYATTQPEPAHTPPSP